MLAMMEAAQHQRILRVVPHLWIHPTRLVAPHQMRPFARAVAHEKAFRRERSPDNARVTKDPAVAIPLHTRRAHLALDFCLSPAIRRLDALAGTGLREGNHSVNIPVRLTICEMVERCTPNISASSLPVKPSARMTRIRAMTSGVIRRRARRGGGFFAKLRSSASVIGSTASLLPYCGGNISATEPTRSRVPWCLWPLVCGNIPAMSQPVFLPDWRLHPSRDTSATPPQTWRPLPVFRRSDSQPTL